MADPFKPRFVDLVRNYTSTLGTGNLVLGSAVDGYRSFAAEIQPGEGFYYSVIGVENPQEFEIGRGTMAADGSISRDPDGGTPTNFTNGTKTVALVAAAEWYESIQAACAGDVQAAATRGAMAGLVDRSKPALLCEGGRDGIFLFDSTDRSADVSLDTRQAVHVAPASDPTGVSGAWVRRFSGALKVGWFGTAADGVTDDSAAIQAALTYLENKGGGELRLDNATYATTGTLLNFGDDVTIDARGATVTSSDPGSIPMLFIGGGRVKILGGTWHASNGARQFDIEGTNSHFDHCTIIDSPEQNTQQIYVRYGADGFTFTNCTMSGNNAAIELDACDALIAFNEFNGHSTSGDDCIAIKAMEGITENIRIIGNKCRHHTDLVGIGSNIGTLGSDDPGYSRQVRNVIVTGNSCEDCAGLIYIKPGGGSKDYRNGLVEGVTVSDNTLFDLTGDRFAIGIRITAGFGGMVRNVRGDNNLIVARSHGDSSTGHKCALDIYGMPNGAAPAFADIDVGFTFRDPHEGAAFGTAGTSGYPVENIVNIENGNPNGLSISGINLRLEGNGCSKSGVEIDAGMDDAVTIDKLKLSNVNVGGGTKNAGVLTSSRIRITGPERVSIGQVQGNPYLLTSGTTADVICNVEQHFFAELVAAGNTEQKRPWSAPRKAFLTRADLVISNTVNQSADDSNYTQIDFRNHGGSGNIFANASTKLTGGQPFLTNFANVLFRAADLGTTGGQNDCVFQTDSVLVVNKSDGGTGNALTDAYLRLHWAPC